MPKKLLSLLAEEITEQGFGRYFQDAILPSGQRIGDVKSVDLSTSKPINITISDTEDLPSDTDELSNKVIDDEDVVFQNIVKDSEKSIGTNYCYGGNDPESGIDCSSFIQFYYKNHGISVPRTADGQYKDSKKFKNKDDLKVGDLIFFEETYALPKGSASHVGIVYEIHPNGQIDMIHAGGKKVNILKNVLEDNYYKKHFLSFGTFRKGIPPKKVEPNTILDINTNLKKELPNKDKNGGNVNKETYVGPNLIDINKLNKSDYYSVTSKRGDTYGWRKAIWSLCSPAKPRYCDWHWHAGRDYSNSEGVPIAILKKGEVIEKGPECFKIKHYDGSETKYCHCNRVYVKKGNTVLPGDIVSTVGNVGLSTGPHLHFEYYPSNKIGRTETHASLKKGKVKRATVYEKDPLGIEDSYIVFVKSGKKNDFEANINKIRSLG